MLDDDIQLDGNIIPILQFAYKVACNMGLPDFVQIDDEILPLAEPFEVNWAQDDRLYSNKAKDDQSKANKIEIGV